MLKIEKAVSANPQVTVSPAGGTYDEATGKKTITLTRNSDCAKFSYTITKNGTTFASETNKTATTSVDLGPDTDADATYVVSWTAYASDTSISNTGTATYTVRPPKNYTVYFVYNGTWGDNFNIHVWKGSGTDAVVIISGATDTPTNYTITPVSDYTNLYKVDWTCYDTPEKLLFKERGTGWSKKTNDYNFNNGNYYEIGNSEGYNGSTGVPTSAIESKTLQSVLLSVGGGMTDVNINGESNEVTFSGLDGTQTYKVTVSFAESGATAEDWVLKSAVRSAGDYAMTKGSTLSQFFANDVSAAKAYVTYSNGAATLHVTEVTINPEASTLNGAKVYGYYIEDGGSWTANEKNLVYVGDGVFRTTVKPTALTAYLSLYVDSKYNGNENHDISTNWSVLTISQDSSPTMSDSKPQFKISNQNGKIVDLYFRVNNDGKYEVRYEERIDAYMPLTRADFKDGKAHYFLVGARQGDWHLQPEWEFQEVSAGNYEIPGRFVYPGIFGIAKVTSYEDYANHRFELFSKKAAELNKENLSVTGLESKGSQQGYVSYKNGASLVAVKFKQSKSDNTELAMWIDYDKKGDRQDDRGWWMDKITLSVDALTKNPTGMTIVPGADPKNSSERVFQLVGSHIYNKGFSNSSADGKKTPMAALLSNMDGWQEGWIQYDSKGKPYYDATGHYLYHTTYNESWFEDHPVFFEDANGKQFGSESITFVNIKNMDDLDDDPYREFYKSIANTDNNITTSAAALMGGSADNGTAYNYKINVVGARPADSSATPSGDNTKWECFVVKDVWIDGEFKIWSGMGGNSLKYEGFTDSATGSRWNGPNGGPDLANSNTTVSAQSINSGGNVNFYRNYKNVNNSNYKVASRTFFNRIIMWYNEEDGVDKSFMTFIQEDMTPAITATKVNETSVSYDWSILNVPAGSAKEIESVSIQLKSVKGSGDKTNVGSPITVDIPTGPTVATAGNYTTTLSSALSGNKSSLAAGSYVYEITLKFADEENAKTVTSNKVTLYSSENQLDVSAHAYQLLLLKENIDNVNPVYKHGVNVFEADIRAAGKTVEDLKTTNTYLTYDEGGKVYYLVNIGSGENEGKVADLIPVDASRARKLIKHYGLYRWTSNFYIRALDMTDAAKHFNRLLDEGKLKDEVNLDELDLVVSVDDFIMKDEEKVEIGTCAGFKTVRTKKVVDGKQTTVDYLCGVLKRAGNLEPNEVKVTVSYTDDIARSPYAEAYLIPEKPRAFALSDVKAVALEQTKKSRWDYYYKYEEYLDEETRKLIGAEVDANGKVTKADYDFVRVKTSSNIPDIDKDDLTIYFPTDGLYTRDLQCVINFYRPNVVKEIIDNYMMYYEVEIVEHNEETGVDTPLYSGIYYDNTVYAGVARPADRYQFTIKHCHPSAKVYPVMRVKKTYYVTNDRDFNTEKPATYGINPTVVAKNTTTLTTPTLSKLKLRKQNGGNGLINWAFKSIDIEDAGDIIDDDDTYNPWDPDKAGATIVPGTRYYMIEAKNSSGEYDWCRFLLDKTDIKAFDGTVIAYGFQSDDAPVTHYYPVYLFRSSHDGQIDGEDDANITQLSKVKNAPAAAPRRVEGVTYGTGTINGKKYLDLSEDPNYTLAKGGGNSVSSSDTSTTGVEDVMMGAPEQAEYWTIQGVKVANPQPGQVYIVRRGGVMTKELLK